MLSRRVKERQGECLPPCPHPEQPRSEVILHCPAPWPDETLTRQEGVAGGDNGKEGLSAEFSEKSSWFLEVH